MHVYRPLDLCSKLVIVTYSWLVYVGNNNVLVQSRKYFRWKLDNDRYGLARKRLYICFLGLYDTQNRKPLVYILVWVNPQSVDILGQLSVIHGVIFCK